MRYPSPERWSDQLLRAVGTVLIACAACFIAVQLMHRFLPALLVLGALLLVMRLALGLLGGRDRW